MSQHELSPRETEIVQLAIEGLTNEGIAHKLTISVGTVNTYWVRIRMKVGGVGRTDTVAKIISDRADRALRTVNTERGDMALHIAEREQRLLELRAELALLQFALDQIKSTVWATDRELRLQIVANGEMPSVHCGVPWEVGKTVFEIFKSEDRTHPAVAAHLGALDGIESNVRLSGEFANMLLRAMPMRAERTDEEIVGCIGIMNVLAP